MKPGKLVKKLRREAVANPKKAAILGLLVVVSLYFWIPMVAGWLGKEKAASAAPEAASVPSVQSSAPATASAAKPEPRLSWEQIDRWMRTDPRMTTASPPPRTRDPFAFPANAVAKSEATEEESKPPPPLTPDEAGLSLSGTIIGLQSRSARINGRTYAVGETIDVKDEKTTIQAAFKVMEVHPRRVILQSDAGRFELSLPDPAKSGKIEFQRIGP